MMEIPFLPCPIKYLLHIDCPGCGFQRSVWALLEGDVGRSLATYPATVPIVALVVFLALHLRFRFRNGAAVLKVGYAACVATVVGFYVYKVVTHQII
jgi:hypothetical protein